MVSLKQPTYIRRPRKTGGEAHLESEVLIAVGGHSREASGGVKGFGEPFTSSGDPMNAGNSHCSSFG